ncbi:hypothetical protein N7455_008013 [Penicillium solitum]|uniref:uncharacterized protein n=1 Tax=Penicillium solitum TaxID=60172 RepID=UPI0032C3FF5A|nr:hypothetical protein N7455_008013 [Penicillium solitum]
MHHPAPKYIACMLISGATPAARMDQSIAPAHHRTTCRASAYPMQPSSRVGVHSSTRGHRTGKAEITRFPDHNPDEDSDQRNKLKSGSPRPMF